MNNDLKYRIDESNRILSKFPYHIPVIVKSDSIIKLKKTKFLVPRDVNASYLNIAIRKQMENVDSSKAIFMFCGKNLICGNHMMHQIYDEYIKSKNDRDLFLYITLSIENTFG